MAASLETGADPSLRETRQIAHELGVDPGTGLGTAEAQRRLEADGPNELRGIPPVPAWRKFVSQFHNPLIYLLLPPWPSPWQPGWSREPTGRRSTRS